MEGALTSTYAQTGPEVMYATRSGKKALPCKSRVRACQLPTEHMRVRKLGKI